MICNGLFSESLSKAIDQNDLEDSIETILKMICYSKKHDTTYYRDEKSVYVGSVKGNDFATWLYDNSNPMLPDIKRELSNEIDRAKPFDSNLSLSEKDTFIVGITFETNIINIFDYLKFKQNRLKQISQKCIFFQELPECYYYLYFNINVQATLNTLNNSFTSIRNDIIFHLNKLDLFCKEYPERLKVGNSNAIFSASFKKFSGIDCSVQSSRSSVKVLKMVYTSEGKSKDLICELHTKFDRFNRDTTKQDRIYFHKGKEGLFENKLVVFHIGDHV